MHFKFMTIEKIIQECQVTFYLILETVKYKDSINS